MVCGVGNNAGDGFVAARNLMRHNDVVVLLASPPAEIRTGVARRAYERIKHIATPSVGVTFANFDVVVDALLGTGTKKEVREPYRTLINRLNESAKFIVSIDVPSGLGTDVAVRPNMTVTFTDVKCVMNPENSGQIVVKDIGIPLDASRFVGPGEFIYYPTRRPDSHKGENGKVLIIGGGPFTGAPALAGLAAYRTGVDIVSIAVPEVAFEVVAGYSPNVIVHRLHGKFLSEEDIEHCLRIAKKPMPCSSAPDWVLNPILFPRCATSSVDVISHGHRRRRHLCHRHGSFCAWESEELLLPRYRVRDTGRRPLPRMRRA